MYIALFLRQNQAYSGMLRTLSNTRKFTTWPCSESQHLKLEVYSKLSETFTRHILIPAIVITVYESIIQPYSGILQTLCDDDDHDDDELFLWYG